MALIKKKNIDVFLVEILEKDPKISTKKIKKLLKDKKYRIVSDSTLLRKLKKIKQENKLLITKTQEKEKILQELLLIFSRYRTYTKEQIRGKLEENLKLKITKSTFYRYMNELKENLTKEELPEDFLKNKQLSYVFTKVALENTAQEAMDMFHFLKQKLLKNKLSTHDTVALVNTMSTILRQQREFQQALAVLEGLPQFNTLLIEQNFTKKGRDDESFFQEELGLVKG